MQASKHTKTRRAHKAHSATGTQPNRSQVTAVATNLTELLARSVQQFVANSAYQLVLDIISENCTFIREKTHWVGAAAGVLNISDSYMLFLQLSSRFEGIISHKKKLFIDRFPWDFGSICKITRRRHFVSVLFSIWAWVLEIVRHFFLQMFLYYFQKSKSQ